MKINRMLTALVLSVISWLVAISGLVTSGYLIFKGNELNSLLIGFLILLGSLLLAAVVRMVGNIGQILFDLKRDIHSLNQDLKTQLQNQAASLIKTLQELSQSLSSDLHELLQSFNRFSQDTQATKDVISKGFLSLNQDLKAQLQSLSSDLHGLKDCFEQINCDSRDINQNIQQIKTFFEQIERHLDLKK